jgi:predicted TPR repeat methyltransferase
MEDVLNLLQSGRFEEARGFLAKLAYDDPTNVAITVPYVQCLLQLEHWHDALDFLTGPAVDKPLDSLLWTLQAKVHFLQENYDQAIRILKPRIEQGLGADDELELLLDALVSDRQFELAESLFRQHPQSVEVLSSYALQLAEMGQMAAGLDVLELGRERFDTDARFQNSFGLVLMCEDRFADSIEHFTNAVELDPQVAVYWYNLGLARCNNQQPEQAIASYRKAIDVQDNYYRAWINLGTTLVDLEQLGEGQQALARVVELRPRDAMAWHRLGNVQRLRDQPEAAVHSLRQAIKFDMDSIPSWELLVRLLEETEQHDEAINALEDWLNRHPDHPIATHMQAALSGDSTPNRASREYVEAVFDVFADSFNDSLRRLDYHTPEQVGQLLQQQLGESQSWRVLDAGCGTGLVGPFLRPLAVHLVGVDLSSKMLEHAEQTGSYDALAQADLVEYLEQPNEPFDLIVVVDTLNYFGDLTDVMRLLFQSLRPGGYLLFTVEEGPLMGDDGYYLQPHGRYVHTPPHIIEQMGENGIPGGNHAENRSPQRE